MTDGDRAAVDVDLGWIEAEFAHHRQRLRREGLVGLDEIEIGDLPAGLFERLAGGRDRPGSHDFGIDPGVRPRRDARQGFRPRFFASSADIRTMAAAPSLSPEALAAVTDPSLAKAGRRPETLS